MSFPSSLTKNWTLGIRNSPSDTRNVSAKPESSLAYVWIREPSELTKDKESMLEILDREAADISTEMYGFESGKFLSST